MNVPIKEISKRVGQKSKYITLHYSHSTVKGTSDLIKKLETEGEDFDV